MIKKQYVKSRNISKVTFELPKELEAEAIYLHADDNGWEPLAFDKLKNGKWRLLQEFEPGQTVQFRYRLIQDGQEHYLNDDDADGTVFNDQGTENAVLHC